MHRLAGTSGDRFDTHSTRTGKDIENPACRNFILKTIEKGFAYPSTHGTDHQPFGNTKGASFEGATA